MTKRGLIVVVVSVILSFTPAGLHVYMIPLLIGCIGGKIVWEFYIKFFFGND